MVSSKMQELHSKGECRPCAFFIQMADGCRLGDECTYCHLCTPSALKAVKKEKVKEKRRMKAINALYGQKLMHFESTEFNKVIPADLLGFEGNDDSTAASDSGRSSTSSSSLESSTSWKENGDTMLLEPMKVNIGAHRNMHHSQNATRTQKHKSKDRANIAYTAPFKVGVPYTPPNWSSPLGLPPSNMTPLFCGTCGSLRILGHNFCQYCGNVLC